MKLQFLLLAPVFFVCMACASQPNKQSQQSKLNSNSKKKISTLAKIQYGPKAALSAKSIGAKKSTAKNAFYTKDAQDLKKDYLQRSEGLLYSDALVAANKKQYGVALMTIDQLIKQYPKSSKISKALFLKIKVYKQMNLDTQSRMIFAQLKKQYPGSMEASLAEGLIRK